MKHVNFIKLCLHSGGTLGIELKKHMVIKNDTLITKNTHIKDILQCPWINIDGDLLNNNSSFMHKSWIGIAPYNRSLDIL